MSVPREPAIESLGVCKHIKPVVEPLAQRNKLNLQYTIHGRGGQKYRNVWTLIKYSSAWDVQKDVYVLPHIWCLHAWNTWPK